MTFKRFSLGFCLVAIGLASGCFPQGDQQDRRSGVHPSLSQGYQLKLRTYESCDSLQEHIDQQFQALQHYQTHVISTDIMTGAVADMTPENSVEANQDSVTDGEASITNLQEKGVDEPDFVKRNDHHIYVMHLCDARK